MFLARGSMRLTRSPVQLSVCHTGGSVKTVEVRIIGLQIISTL